VILRCQRLGWVTHDPVECARSQFFGEPEHLVDVSARARKVAETCVWKVTVREEQHHFLAITTDGGVCRLHLRCTSWWAKSMKVSKLVSCSSMVRTLGVTFEILGVVIYRTSAPARIR